MAKREQTPLEKLARDHNWKMGDMRRSEGIITNWFVQSAKVAALNALQVERQYHIDTYERRKSEISEFGQVLS